MGLKSYLEKIEREVKVQEDIERIERFSKKVSYISEKIEKMSTSKLLLSKNDKEDLLFFEESLNNLESTDIIVNFMKNSMIHAIEDLISSINESEVIEELFTKEELIELAVLRDQIISLIAEVVSSDSHLYVKNSKISVLIEIPIDKIYEDELKTNCLKYMLLEKGVTMSDNNLATLVKNNEKFGYYDFEFEIQDKLKSFGMQRTIVKHK